MSTTESRIPGCVEGFIRVAAASAVTVMAVFPILVPVVNADASRPDSKFQVLSIGQCVAGCEAASGQAHDQRGFQDVAHGSLLPAITVPGE
jgi:hypothetical protein